MLSISITIPSSASISLLPDYELLASMFQDEIIEIDNSNSQSRLTFLLKQNYEIDISQSTSELLIALQLDDLILSNDMMYIPYWIKFTYDKHTHVLMLNFYVYWIKYNKNLIEILHEAISQAEEPYLYNIIELTKTSLSNSMNKDLLLNLIREISELNIINMNQSSTNFLFKSTGANKDLGDFLYENKKQSIIEHQHKTSSSNKKTTSTTTTTTTTTGEAIDYNETIINNDSNDSNYELFFKKGGIVGEIIQDRKSIFQAHAININSINEIEKYHSYLIHQKKIKKATHNITAYRILNQETGKLIEDYNDDGESEAGIRLLGIIQKMKIVNAYVMVSRWFGGIMLHQDRFKHINDAARILLNNNIGKFTIEK